LSFRAYMRLDGWVAIAAGALLCVLGLSQGRQAAGDAVGGGMLMILGTGAFMVVWHRVPFRRPGGWFTVKPLARAGADETACSRRRLMLGVAAKAIAFGGMAVGLSYLTQFWLTYVDVGVWAVAIGIIKIGPATAAITRHESQSGVTYRVVRRPLRGLVKVTYG
jgi:hypothetical protein